LNIAELKTSSPWIKDSLIILQKLTSGASSRQIPTIKAWRVVNGRHEGEQNRMLCLCSVLGRKKKNYVGSDTTPKKERKEKKNYASSKKLLTSIKEKGPLVKKSPFTRKEKEGQRESGELRADKLADLRESPDWFEGGENAQEDAWSEQAYEHSAQNEHGV